MEKLSPGSLPERPPRTLPARSMMGTRNGQAYSYAALVEEKVTDVVPAELHAVEADACDRAKVE